MKKKLLSLLFCLTISFASFAQGPFSLSLKRDLPIGLGGLTLAVGGHIGYQNLKSFSEAQIQTLDPLTVPGFDRFATRNWRPRVARASDFLLLGSIALPYMTIAGQDMRENYGTIALMGVETFLLTQGITSLAKVIFHRTRPYAYNPSVSIEERLQKDARASFFSGHTSQAAAGCFFFAAVYQQYNPTSKARFVVWSLAAAIPAVVGFMRVHSGKHFLTDVLVGYGVGASVGILVPRLHR